MPATYSVKVALRAVSPMIWRRLRLEGTTSLAALHFIIQESIEMWGADFKKSGRLFHFRHPLLSGRRFNGEAWIWQGIQQQKESYLRLRGLGIDQFFYAPFFYNPSRLFGAHLDHA